MFIDTVPIVLGIGALSCVDGDSVYIALGIGVSSCVH